MPLYDFRCSTCGAVYEVKRPASRLAEPLLCAVDNAPCERLLTAPSFVTKSNPSLRGPSAAQRASWRHFGHSHGADASSHGHSPTDTGPSAAV